MAVTPAERQSLLAQLNALAQQDLDTLWAAAALAGGEFAAYLADGFPALVDPYHQTAAQFAATWFEQSDPVSPYIAVTAAPIVTEQLAQSLQWALGATGDQGRRRLTGTLQRAVFDGARDTTLANVAATDSRWARYASVTACAFCRLLATRRNAYRSRNTAATKVHDDCHCLPVEVRQGSYEPPDYIQQWEQQYIKSVRQAGSGDPTHVLAAWRQLDGVHAT